MGDHMAGMTLVAAVCAALVARARTGTGQLVSTSLYRQGAYTISFDLNTFLLTGHAIAIGTARVHGQPVHEQLCGGRRPAVLDRRSARSIGTGAALCRAVVGRPDWLTDYRFATGAAAPRTPGNSSASSTRSSRPSHSTSGRKSLQANRISSGRRSTRWRMSSPTNSSTPRVA